MTLTCPLEWTRVECKHDHRKASLQILFYMTFTAIFMVQKWNINISETVRAYAKECDVDRFWYLSLNDIMYISYTCILYYNIVLRMYIGWTLAIFQGKFLSGHFGPRILRFTVTSVLLVQDRSARGPKFTRIEVTRNTKWRYRTGDYYNWPGEIMFHECWLNIFL